jgi:hypothetical protein
VIVIVGPELVKTIVSPKYAAHLSGQTRKQIEIGL